MVDGTLSRVNSWSRKNHPTGYAFGESGKNYKFLVVPIAVLPSVEKSVRVNVMLPEGTLRLIDAVSKNRSAFLASAAERLLGEQSMRRKA